MTKRTAGILGTLVLAIFLTAFAGSALAGNGNGKDNGKSQADAAAQPSDATVSPGNSENAPGHNKASASVTTDTSTTGSASQNSPATPGMKPTNSTSKNTTCTTGGGGGSGVTCAPSSSNTAATQMGAKDASKRYGNGTTAAQIATASGAPSGTTIYGPGNSQPHKVALCPNKKNHGGGVDVHALKSHAAKSCASSTPTSTQTMTSQNGSTSVTGTATVTGTTTVKGSRTEAPGLSVAAANGGVLGVTATVSAGKSGNTPVGGVLGALTTVGSGNLPFTGFPLWVAALLAVALIGMGLTLRRAGRATA